MACKRPFHNVESYEIAPKHPRQHESLTQPSPFIESFLCENGSHKFISGETVDDFSQSQVGRLAVKETADEISNRASVAFGDSSVETAKNTVHGTLNNSSSCCLWIKSDAFEGYGEANESFHKPVFPHFFDLDLQEFCSTLAEHPLQKTVPVGPEYQADIPDWNPPSLNNYSPIPDTESSVFTTCIGVENEGGCYCLDKGSIRCVRQHVKESRSELIENIGPKFFEELGFCDMGEVVAERWSDDEEKMFRDIVFSNNGNNYWHSLEISFPARSKTELVSYYFNVFKLRQRAEQNRLDPTNIDSDNDDWQGFEARDTEEDNGFVVESLDGQDILVHDQATHEKDIPGDTENGISECASQEHLNNSEKLKPKEGEGNFYDVSGLQV